MAISATRTPKRWVVALGRESGQLAFDEGSVIGFKDCEAGIEQTALGNDDDVEPRRDLITTENLSNQSFGAISYNGSAEFSGGRNPQPARPSPGTLVGEDENRAVSAADLDPEVVNPLEILPATNAFGRVEPHGGVVHLAGNCARYDSELTVRRFRPFARRRFRTRRPFFVLIRTKKPWVRLLWRRLG